MKKIDPSEHEFVAKVWLVQHHGYSEECAKSNWERVELIPASYDDEDYFYCDGRRYRVTNEWQFFTPADRLPVPSEMVRAAQPEWLDTDQEYANKVIADSEQQTSDVVRFMSDDELAGLSERLPAHQRAAIWALAILLCLIVWGLIVLIVARHN